MNLHNLNYYITSYHRKLKVKTKLFLLFSFLIVILTTFVSLYFPYMLEKFLIYEVKSKSESITQMTATSIAAAVDFDDMIGLREALEATYINTNIEYLVIHDVNNKVYYSRFLSNAQNYNYDKNFNLGLSHDGLAIMSQSKLIVNGKIVGYLFIGYSFTEQKLEIIKMRQSILIVGLLIIMFGTITTYLIVSFFVKPLDDMSKVFSEISNDDLTKRVKIETEDEIGQLGKSFNLMVDKLEKASNEMKSMNLTLESNNSKLHDLNATKDKFFSIIAHDLKNPLGSFREISKLLCDDYHSFEEDDIKDLLNLMKESSNQVYNLLENLLEWSQTQKGNIQFNPTDIQLSALVDIAIQIHQLAAGKKQIKIINSIPSDTVIFADAALLNTIFRNFISNAIKYSQNFGVVEIGLSKVQSDSFIQVYVKDAGIGMSKDALGKLFRIDENVSTYGTNGEKGTGLGLILCKEFAERNGGNIWAESEEGKGSTFYFTLPVKNEE